MNYGRAIKMLLAAREMTQQDLALRMEVDSATVSRLVRSNVVPSGRSLERISEALDVPMYLLVLLASDDTDLKGLNKSEATGMGKQLLAMLMSTESKARTRNKHE